MTKKFVVKLRKGGLSGEVVATSQVITIKGLGDTPPITSDFKDGILGGAIRTSDKQACFVKTISAPDWTVMPVAEDCVSGQCIIKGTSTIHYNWTTSLIGVTSKIRWRAVFPNTTTLFTGGGLDVTNGTIDTIGYSGTFHVITTPIKTAQQFQITLETNEDNGILLARSKTCTILPAELTISGPSTAVSNQPIPAVFKGYANDTVNYTGPTNGTIQLDNRGQKVVDLSSGGRLEPGVYTWSATGLLTTGNPQYTLSMIDMFGRIEYPKDGKDGAAGNPGVPAVPGVPGSAGIPGTSGTDGTPGTGGTDGTPGSNNPIIVVNTAPGGTPSTVTVETTTAAPSTSTSQTTIAPTVKVTNTKIRFPTDTGYAEKFNEYYVGSDGSRKPGKVEIEFTFQNREGRTIYAELAHGSTSANDFASAANQTLSTDIATVLYTATDDKTTEGAETFTVKLYTDITSNPFYTSAAISLLDNSIPEVAAASQTTLEYKFKITPEDTDGSLTKTYEHTDTINTKFSDGPPGATYTITKSYSPPQGYKEAPDASILKTNLAGTMRGRRAIEITELYYASFKSEPTKTKMADYLKKNIDDKVPMTGSTSSIESLIKADFNATKPPPTQVGTLDSTGYASVTLDSVNQLSAPGIYTYDVELSKFTGTVTSGPNRRYVVTVKPKLYDMIIEPKGSVIDRYEQAVTDPLVIKITGGPPMANLVYTSSASVANWGGTAEIKLDANGNFTSDRGVFSAKGTYTWKASLRPDTYIGILKTRDQSTENIDQRTYIITVVDGSSSAKTKYDPVFEVIHDQSGTVIAGDNQINTLEKFGVRLRNGPPDVKFDYTISSDNGTFSPDKNKGELALDANGQFATPTDAHVDQPGTYTYDVSFKGYGDNVEFVNGPTRKLEIKAVNASEFKVSPTTLSAKVGSLSDFTFSGPSGAAFSVEEVTPAAGHKNPYMIYYHEAYDEFIKENPGKDIESVEAQAYSEKHYTKDPTDKISPSRVKRLVDNAYLAYNPECDEAWAKTDRKQSTEDYAKTFHATQENSLKTKNGFYYSPDESKNRQTGSKKQTNTITKTMPTNRLNTDGVLKSTWDNTKESARLLPYAYVATHNGKKTKFRYHLLRSDMTLKEPDAATTSAAAPSASGLTVDGKSDLVVYKKKTGTAFANKFVGSSEENVTVSYFHPNIIPANAVMIPLIMTNDKDFPESKLRGSKSGTVNREAGVGGGVGPTAIIDETKWPLQFTNWGHETKASTSLAAAKFPAAVGIDASVSPLIPTSDYQFVGMHWNATNKSLQIMIGIKKGGQGFKQKTQVELGVVETGRFWRTFIPPVDTKISTIWKSSDIPASVIDIGYGKNGVDILQITDLIQAKKPITLSIGVVGSNEETTPMALSSIKNSKLMHPYLIMYPDAMAEYKRGTKTPSQAAIDHYNSTGKNNADYIDPYRMLALIHTPYFNFYPDAEKEYNDANPANATGTEGYSFNSGTTFALKHYNEKGKLKSNPKYLSPDDAKKKWNTMFDTTVKTKVKLSKDTKSYDYKISKLGELPATLPYTYQVDGDKSDNVVTYLLFIETPPLPVSRTQTSATVSSTTTTKAPDSIPAAKEQPAPLKALKITPASITAKEDVPVMMTFEGEPNDQLYVEYFDPKIPDDETYIEYNLDLYNEWQANSKAYIAAGFNVKTASEAHYNNSGKAEGRRSPAETLALDKIWRANGGKKNAYIKLPSDGKLELDISAGGRENLRHRRLPYSWKVTGDKSVGSVVGSVTITQPPLKKVTATAKAASKLLRVREFFQDGTGDNVLFYIGDYNESQMPTEVVISIIESNVAALPVGAKVFEYPAKISAGSVISPTIHVDENGTSLGGRINASPANQYGYVIKLRISVVSSGGTWTSSATSTPSDLTYHGGTGFQSGA